MVRPVLLKVLGITLRQGRFYVPTYNILGQLVLIMITGPQMELGIGGSDQVTFSRRY